MHIPNLYSSNGKKTDTLFLLHTLSTQGGALLSLQFLWVRRYQDGSNLYPGQCSHLSIADRMILPLGQEHSHGKTLYIIKQVLMRS